MAIVYMFITAGAGLQEVELKRKEVEEGGRRREAQPTLARAGILWVYLSIYIYIYI